MENGPPSAPAKRSLGQNFLCDPNTVRRIVDALEAPPEATVLEIGPGRGALTGLLLERFASVLALEKDGDLAARIKAKHPALGVAVADALRFPWERVDRLPGLYLAGNLPYNVASPLLWEFVSRARGWSRGVFMVQWEVGRRLAAAPGGKEYGALSAWVQNFVSARVLFKVPPTVFRPRPKIDSAVVAMLPRPEGELPGNSENLSALLKTCFQRRRKQLGVILRGLGEGAVDAAMELGLDTRSRPETLSPERFRALADALSAIQAS
ncbi:16S rRNA (adenine(1518)-N(6)/adenine(1519)-N(6))-dimethyltransferase RsmA [Desulfohalovibrio reitneri]|uniref:16S rRNA (adenine(1518)-N(6)/adenine(1519)-N(6))- dimethyltransferase RsmA n=1 Tax=Desulfohalovibrio reitneri TaxID=1307759 RepID=UPI0004A75BCE|nr:16S rRNA (adenine(1518)-N(6)/adenine(1519)-N(6))-dimethyltransferase RsmA [Desulfohalovibrio reitneri]